ncbi:MAG: hypothetical protein ACP5N1_07105 [Candidatus Woesearchaeota archaeon]
MAKSIIKNAIYTTLLSLVTLMPLNTKDNVIISKPSTTFSIENYLSEKFDQKELYVNPFKNIYGSESKIDSKTLSKISKIQKKDADSTKTFDSDSIINKILIDRSAAKIMASASKKANEIFLYEKELLKKHDTLVGLLSEWMLEKKVSLLPENDIFRIKYESNSSNSRIYPDIPKYSFDNKKYNFEKNQLLKEITYYGSNIFNSKKYFISSSEIIKLRKNKTKPTDCITFVLESLTESSGKNYFKKSLSDAKGFGNYFYKDGFETVFIASNTIKKEKQYKYNTDFCEGFYAKEVFSRVKDQDYYIDIDYVVTDGDFYRPAFRDFIKETSGFVLIQEGYHLGILVNGNLIDAHYNSYPLYSPVFLSSDFIEKFDNDNPKKDYQTAVLLVPKGSVKAFLMRNKDTFVREQNFYERNIAKQKLLDNFLKLPISN